MPELLGILLPTLGALPQAARVRFGNYVALTTSREVRRLTQIRRHPPAVAEGSVRREQPRFEGVGGTPGAACSGKAAATASAPSLIVIA